jgi:hypothetical protein
MILLTRNRIAKHTIVTLLLGIAVSQNSQACRKPPAEQMVTPDQQIALATDVSVARVIRATPSTLPALGGRPSVEYEFEVQQHLLGFPQSRFILVGAQGETRPGPSSSDHSDGKFWERGGGRLYNDPDCVLRPDFIVGEHYLIFRGKPATWRSFEHIETVRGRPNPNDRWLSFVKEKLQDR